MTPFAAILMLISSHGEGPSTVTITAQTDMAECRRNAPEFGVCVEGLGINAQIAGMENDPACNRVVSTPRRLVYVCRTAAP